MDKDDALALRGKIIGWMAVHGQPLVVSTQVSEDVLASEHLYRDGCAIVSPRRRKADFFIRAERHKVSTELEQGRLFCISDFSCECGKWHGTMGSKQTLQSIILTIVLDVSPSQLNSAFGVKAR